MAAEYRPRPHTSSMRRSKDSSRGRGAIHQAPMGAGAPRPEHGSARIVEIPTAATTYPHGLGELPPDTVVEVRDGFRRGLDGREFPTAPAHHPIHDVLCLPYKFADTNSPRCLWNRSCTRSITASVVSANNAEVPFSELMELMASHVADEITVRMQLQDTWLPPPGSRWSSSVRATAAAVSRRTVTRSRTPMPPPSPTDSRLCPPAFAAPHRPAPSTAGSCSRPMSFGSVPGFRPGSAGPHRDRSR